MRNGKWEVKGRDGMVRLSLGLGEPRVVEAQVRVVHIERRISLVEMLDGQCKVCRRRHVKTNKRAEKVTKRSSVK